MEMREVSIDTAAIIEEESRNLVSLGTVPQLTPRFIEKKLGILSLIILFLP